MLIHSIKIKESPSFKEATFYPDSSFNVFSGASGAGKSVLMESILAFFGLRECNAELLEANITLEGISEDFKGLIDEGECVLTLTKKDKIRYFLNAQSIPKKKIVELFSPFIKHLGAKAYDALSDENLILALDSFCAFKDKKYKEILEKYKESFLESVRVNAEFKDLKNEALRVNELKEFVHFEISKIEKLNPKKGEYEELLALKKEFSKKEKVAKSLYFVKEFLNNTHEVYQFLNLINKESKGLENALSELSAVVEEQEEILEELENTNPEEILNRIEELSALNHRYGGIDEALAYLEEKKNELQKYENIEALLKKCEAKLKESKERLNINTNALREARGKQIKDFEKVLNRALIELKMQKATITLEACEENILGADFLNIILGKNSTLKTLSSGEFNRMRLALLLTQRSENQAIIILDEVDANLSGEESEGVAQVLNQLSSSFQIFAISHQSHMPSFANKHFLVEKGAKTSTIKELDKEGRIKEIARMISGKEITKEALDFAKLRLKDLQ